MSDGKVKKDRWHNVIGEDKKEGDTNVNINVEQPPGENTSTTVEKKVVVKKGESADDLKDDTPTPSTSG